RTGVVLLLTCIFLGPALVYLQNRTIQPTIILARDASQSMNTADRYTDETTAKIAAAALGQSETEVRAARPTRVQIVNKVFAAGSGSLLTDLAKRGKIQAFDFAEQIAKVDHQLPPLVAEGRSSDLWNVVRQSLA